MADEKFVKENVVVRTDTKVVSRPESEIPLKNKDENDNKAAKQKSDAEISYAAREPVNRADAVSSSDDVTVEDQKA